MEGSCSEAPSKRRWPKDDFIDLLFSWSSEDIFDEDLYKDQVESIPEVFDSVKHYLSSYLYPLLEETRAALASSLETVYKSPFAEVLYFREAKPDSLLYDVRVDNWKNRISDRGKEPYRTLPGDLVLLSDSKPESVSDLKRIGRTYTFATVREISDEENGDRCTSSAFKLKAAGEVEVDDRPTKSLYVVYLTNITTQKRIWSALRMHQNLMIIEKILGRSDLGEKDCEVCTHDSHVEVVEKFPSTLLSMLNESQLGAVMASIRKSGCSHEPSVELIWGPPGTGKTSTLSALLYILLGMNVRTIICAPTNTAIAELASRVTTLVRNPVKTKSGTSFLTCPLGGMLLFGNNDRLKVSSDCDIQEIFLDYRVDRLIEILVPLTGWRGCVSSMLDFLEDGVSQHQIFVENEQIKSKEHIDGEIVQGETKSFLNYARERFIILEPPLRNCMLIAVTHLPRRFIDDGIYQNIMHLFSLLDSLENLLFEDSGMTSKLLETIFVQQTMTGSESFSDTTNLESIRRQCVFILRSLRDSLSKLNFPKAAGKSSITEFCFQKASLIFCTVSSAFKLHSLDIEPFQLLVIDEAAQVKECESTIAFQIRGVRHAILVGDECQLPATVSSKVSEEAGFGRSVFERLSSLGHPKHLLNVQYRMHPSISRFPNSKFYQNQILDGLNVQSKSYERSYLQGKMFGPYAFINVRGGREELDDVGVSRRNLVEVAVVVKIVQKLVKAWNSSNEKLSIGLISPYAAQVAAIQDKLQYGNDKSNKFTVKVKSIDGFQGGEEDIIIISTVRSHKGGSIGFLCSPQRTNVALTRARHCLWILGNERTLSRSDSVWEAIVSDAKDRQCFFNADDDCEIGKAIVDVKKELNQLDDLLSGESRIFKDLRWQVMFSDNFRKSFQKLRFSNTKKLVIDLLLKLGRGWRPRKLNVDLKCEKSSYILKHFKVDAYSVVCSIDIVKDSIYMQVLKVWDILPFGETTKLVKRIDSIASMYTDDFIIRCNDRLFERNFEVPLSWSISSEIIRFKSPSNPKSDSGANTSSVESRTYVENSKVSESLLLMKFYSLSRGTLNHLLSDVDGNAVDLPFEVTDEEREIINFPRSSFILGRSGTGKTTILTTKLCRKFQQYCIASRDSDATDENVSIPDEVDDKQHHGGSKAPVLHQLFVTVSPKLCHAVKKSVAQMNSIATEKFSGHDNFMGLDEVSEFKDIPDSFVGIPQEKYPLIVTFHKFLMMLDGTLGESYFQRFPCLRDSSYYEGGRSVALQTFLRKNEVTYNRFASAYWPHFNAKLTKGLDASRVYTEIMSHIKGGPLKGGACDYKRSREDYVSMSQSRISTLSEEQRDTIYGIFEIYEKMKLQLGEFDIADFVSDIHLRLVREDLPGEKMDFVYIDEVQDLTMRHISLFKYICKNIDEGFIFCGDTAQTIARGIDFRFEDIRSLFYNEFLMMSKGCDVLGKKEKGLLSDMFNLSHNFRTHTGVLRLAQSVVDLICHYFPHSIDALAPETSRIYGESPLVLEPGSNENMIMSIFGHGGKSGEKWVGFGADQVILVRDDSARNEISSFVGHQALVLTIVECKGLEFQDVLLYNFFGSSPLNNQWRVVYDYLKDKNLLHADSAESFPSFSQSRHNILCSELKQLYVAITRTRQRLWICENSIEASKPMLDYWRRLSLVQVRKIDDSLAEAMQRASTPEEWKSQGQKLMWEKNYEMATMCFEKAGEEKLEKMAKASGLRAAADSLHSSNSEEANIMLREAAELFDSINKADLAAQCFIDLGGYERAGKIYRDKTSELGKAGECFLLAGKTELAAQVYASGSLIRECLLACTQGSHFDLGLQYIEKWKLEDLSNCATKARYMEIDRIVQEFLENCALKCYSSNDKPSMMNFVRAFCSAESKRNFLKPRDFLEELLDLEEELGNFNEASEIAKSLGDTLREADLLEKAGRFSDACLLILTYVVSKALWVSGNQGWPLKSFPRKEELLNRVISVSQKVSETFHASVCAQASFLLYDGKNLFELMQFYRASKQYEAPISEILVVRKLLDVHFQANATKYEWDHDLLVDSSLFDQRITRNQVSSGSFIYLWNLWKAHSFKILECIDSLETKVSFELEGVVGFCFNYFGLRLHDNSSVAFHLVNPDASWVKIVDGFILRNRNVATLEARHFASAARKFWLQDLLVVGLRVLDTLQHLHMSSIKKCLPLYCQSMCLLHIFDIAKFFLDLKSINMNYQDGRKLQNFVQLSTNYFYSVFPLDPRASLSQNMISLRETELSRNLLGECVIRNILRWPELSMGQIGLAVMTMLGNGKLKHSFYDNIDKRILSGKPWKVFIANLKQLIESNFAALLREHLCEALHLALAETYSIHWRANDYISPNCFLYLVERLLILMSHPRGYFFTTKSSFVEYLVTLPPDASPRTVLATQNKLHPERIINFVVQVVDEFVYNRIAAEDWITRSGVKSKSYYPVIVLRLLMILCVLSINWDLPFEIFNDKMHRRDITYHLPRDFFDALRPKKRGYVAFVSAVATAFKLVGDPLLVVVPGDVNRKFPYPDAVLIDLRSFSSKTDIMKTLFPCSKDASHCQPTTVASIEGEDTVVNSNSSETNSNSAPNSSSKDWDLEINWDLIGEISSEESESLKSLVLRKKDNISKTTSAISRLIELWARTVEDKDFTFDASGLIGSMGELNDLLSLVSTSEVDSEAMSKITEILKSMQALRPQLDALQGMLVGSNDHNAEVAVSEEKADEKTSECNLDNNDDSKSKDSVSVEVDPDRSDKGNGKSNKKENKSKYSEAEDSSDVEVEPNQSNKRKGKNNKKNKSGAVEVEHNPSNKGKGKDKNKGKGKNNKGKGKGGKKK